MRLAMCILSAALLVLALPAAVYSDEGQCDCSLAAKNAAQEAVQTAAVAVEKLQQSCAADAQTAKLKYEQELQKLEADQSSCSAKAELASQTVQELHTKLQSTTQTIEQLRSQVTDAEHKLQVAESRSAKLAASTSATGASMESLRAELESAKAKLSTLEKAWVPVRAQNWLDQAVAVTKEHYAKAVASEHGQKVHQALLDSKHKACALWKQMQPQVQTALKTTQAKVKVAAAQAEIFYQKHIQDAEWWKQAQLQFERVESELRHIVKKSLQEASPPINTYADPVSVQYIVYIIFALPVTLLVWIVAAFTCGTRKPAAASTLPRQRGPGAKRVRA